MKPLSVWYHCKISGEGIPDPEYAMLVLASQMDALKQSGLADAASEIHVGVNGPDSDALLAAAFSPEKAQLHIHGPEARTEIPTMEALRKTLRPGWYYLYHHTKGVTHPHQLPYEVWRGRMQTACVENWRYCIGDLDRGLDAVGCHWLTPERYPSAVTSPFFGGTFWWARSEYLMQLPVLPAATWANRFEAESWIGRRRPYPRIQDYYPGWP